MCAIAWIKLVESMYCTVTGRMGDGWVAICWFKLKGCHTWLLVGVQHTTPVSIHIVSAGFDPVCLVIGIRWVAAKARRLGFSETHANLEAFILRKRCLVKVQRCSLQPSPSNDSPALCPGLETEAVMDMTGETGTDTHTHTRVSITVRRDGYDWWKLWTLFPESFTSFLSGLGQPSWAGFH